MTMKTPGSRALIDLASASDARCCWKTHERPRARTCGWSRLSAIEGEKSGPKGIETSKTSFMMTLFEFMPGERANRTRRIDATVHDGPLKLFDGGGIVAEALVRQATQVR